MLDGSEFSGISLQQFKLICILQDEFTDEEVSQLMLEVIIESEEDLKEFCGVLHKYRPEIEDGLIMHLDL